MPDATDGFYIGSLMAAQGMFVGQISVHEENHHRGAQHAKDRDKNRNLPALKKAFTIRDGR